MKTIGTVVYEIEDELSLGTLPNGTRVLRYDKQFGFHKFLEVGVDEFSRDTDRYAYFLLESPKITINPQHLQRP